FFRTRKSVQSRERWKAKQVRNKPRKWLGALDLARVADTGIGVPMLRDESIWVAGLGSGWCGAADCDGHDGCRGAPAEGGIRRVDWGSAGSGGRVGGCGVVCAGRVEDSHSGAGEIVSGAYRALGVRVFWCRDWVNEPGADCWRSRKRGPRSGSEKGKRSTAKALGHECADRWANRGHW